MSAVYVKGESGRCRLACEQRIYMPLREQLVRQIPDWQMVNRSQEEGGCVTQKRNREGTDIKKSAVADFSELDRDKLNRGKLGRKQRDRNKR
ncbi:MAG: hypothetical protein ACRC8L_10125, partial [Plesiomonas shigelloides]